MIWSDADFAECAMTGFASSVQYQPALRTLIRLREHRIHVCVSIRGQCPIRSRLRTTELNENPVEIAGQVYRGASPEDRLKGRIGRRPPFPRLLSIIE